MAPDSEELDREWREHLAKMKSNIAAPVIKRIKRTIRFNNFWIVWNIVFGAYYIVRLAFTSNFWYLLALFIMVVCGVIMQRSNKYWKARIAELERGD